MTSTKELPVADFLSQNDNNRTSQIADRMKAAVRKLREFYYKYHYEEPISHGRAFGGKPTESIGSFVEYNLRSIHCIRSMAGMCSPCFYSKFPNTFGMRTSSEEYNSFINEQIDFILDHFDETVLSKQDGKSYYKKEELIYPQNEPISCCITPVGSFFDEREIPSIVRRHLIKRLIEISDIHQTDIIFYVESHVKDFNDYFEKTASFEELNLFKRLHLRIVFGFESKDDFVRNVLYGKNLQLNEFELAVNRAKEAHLGAYAFTFVGLYPMTHIEIISDIKESFDYLKKLNVTPVVMFANVQEYTIADILIKSGQYSFVSPITVISILKIMLEVFGRVRDDGYDAWLIADPVGGPPEPSRHIFSDPDTQCCSKSIYTLIKELRKDHEYSGFDEIYRQVSCCSIHKEKTKHLYEPEKCSLLNRTESMLDFIEANSRLYLQHLREEELLFIKAHLLCEGAHVDDVAKNALSQLDIDEGFIHSTNLLLDGRPVNVYLMKPLVSDPACVLSYKNNKFYLSYKTEDSNSDPEFIGEVGFLPIPKWGDIVVDGYKIKDYLRPHSNNCISIWPNQNCSFGNLKCRFCSLSNNGICLNPTTVIKMIEVALNENPLYEVHLSGGVYKSISENISYYSCISDAIHKKYPKIKISLETIPTLSKDGLEQYRRSGISSILMNIEIANEDTRKKICPGKSTISLERYMEAYREAVNIFGKWNVGSVILYGIEGSSQIEIIRLVRKLCEIGVFPVLMPFQPIEDSPMQKCKACDPMEYISLSEKVGNIIKEASAGDTTCTFGCINCGACSIENNYLL